MKANLMFAFYEISSYRLFILIEYIKFYYLVFFKQFRKCLFTKLENSQ